jgi:HTH-type transcriptional regulator / antitoxin HigA
MEVRTIVDFSGIVDYGELLRVLEPRVVTSAEQAASYLEIIDMLTGLPQMSAGHRDLVGLLGCLVYDWEAEHEEPITATPQEMVRHLLAENSLPQAALVPDVFPNRQNVSEFLAGRRRLSYDRAARLAAFFHLSPAAFYPARPAHRGGNTH